MVLRQPGLVFPHLVLTIKGFSLGSGTLPGSMGRGRGVRRRTREGEAGILKNKV